MRTATQYDGLNHQVKLDYAYKERSGIWVGQNTHIESSAKIAAPVVMATANWGRCRLMQGL